MRQKSLVANDLLNAKNEIFMKRLMIIGGFLGFFIGIAFGSAQQSAWPAVIWRASAAALVGGMLMRWWGRIWVQSLEQARRESRLETKTNSAQPSKAKL